MMGQTGEEMMDGIGNVFFALDIAAFVCMILVYSSYHLLCKKDTILLACVPPCSVLLSLFPFLLIPGLSTWQIPIHPLLAAIYSCVGYAIVWAVNKRRRNRGIDPAPMRYMLPAILVSGPVCFIVMTSVFFGISLLISPGF